MSDPSGWTIVPGGPATAFVAPAAHEHGVPVVATAASELRNRAIGAAMGAAQRTFHHICLRHSPILRPNMRKYM